MIKFNPISNLRATQNLRATVSDNPYHNQHIKEITACIDDTIFELQTHYDAIFLMQQQQIDDLNARIEQLEAQLKQPQTVDVFARLNMDIYTLSKILGHSSVTITEQAYLDVTDADIKKRYSKFSPVENIYYGERD